MSWKVLSWTATFSHFISLSTIPFSSFQTPFPPDWTVKAPRVSALNCFIPKRSLHLPLFESDLGFCDSAPRFRLQLSPPWLVGTTETLSLKKKKSTPLQWVFLYLWSSCFGCSNYAPNLLLNLVGFNMLLCCVVR